MSNSKPNSLVYIVVDFNSSKMRGSKRPLRFHHINFPRHTTWKRRPSEGSGRLLSKIKVRKKINLECFREPVAQSCSAKMRHGWGHNIFRKSQDKTTLGWLGLLCQSRTVELQPRNWTTGRPIDLIRRCAWTRVTVSASCRPVSGHLLLLGEKKVFSNALAGCLPQLAASHARRRDFFMNRSAHLTLNRPTET